MGWEDGDDGWQVLFNQFGDTSEPFARTVVVDRDGAFKAIEHSFI